MKILAGVWVTALVSALVPAVNIEAVLAVMTTQTGTGQAVLALTAAVGQMVGKTAWYAAGRYGAHTAWMSRRLGEHRLRAAVSKWEARANGRAGYTAGLLFVSAAAGLPPYMVMAVLAGVLRVPVPLFLLTGLAGRFLRFWAITAGVSAMLAR